MFEVVDGKIAAWRDYFDLATVTGLQLGQQRHLVVAVVGEDLEHRAPGGDELRRSNALPATCIRQVAIAEL